MEGVFSPSQFFLIHWHLSIKFELYNTLYFRTDGVFSRSQFFPFHWLRKKSPKSLCLPVAIDRTSEPITNPSFPWKCSSPSRVQGWIQWDWRSINRDPIGASSNWPRLLLLTPGCWWWYYTCWRSNPWFSCRRCSCCQRMGARMFSWELWMVRAFFKLFYDFHCLITNHCCYIISGIGLTFFFHFNDLG